MNSAIKFKLGKTVATPGALSAFTEAIQQPAEFLVRHQRGDWGDLSADDKSANDAAIQFEGDVDRQGRILSAYLTTKSVKIWIITEWDRSVTTILLPEEY